MCILICRALLLYRRVLTCPSDSSVVMCIKAVTGVRPCLHAVCIREHPCQMIASVSCLRVFCSFVHCIANFPCTRFTSCHSAEHFIFATAGVMYMLSFLTFILPRSDEFYYGFLPPLKLRAAGGILM